MPLNKDNPIYGNIADTFIKIDKDLANSLSTIPKQETPFLDFQRQKEREKTPSLDDLLAKIFKRSPERPPEKPKIQGSVVAGTQINKFTPPVVSTQQAAQLPGSPLSQEITDKDFRRRYDSLHSDVGLDKNEWESLSADEQAKLLNSNEEIQQAAQFVGGKEIEGVRVHAIIPATKARGHFVENQAFAGDPNSWLNKLNRTITGAATAPAIPVLPPGVRAAAQVAGVPDIQLSVSDAAALATIVYGGVQGVRALPQVYAQGKEKALQTAFNTGLDKWIARQSRLPEATRNKLYNYVVGNRNWLVERATNNYLTRIGRDINVTPTQNDYKSVVSDLTGDITQNLTKFTTTNTGVPGQTLSQANILRGITGTVPPTVQSLQGVVGQLTPLPEELKGLVNSVTGLSKQQFLTQYQAGLSEQNLTRRETAQNIDAYIKRSLKLTPEQFYDTYVQPSQAPQAAAPQVPAEIPIALETTKPAFIVDQDGKIARVITWDAEGNPSVVYPGKSGGLTAGTPTEGGQVPHQYQITTGWRPATNMDFRKAVRPSGSIEMIELRMWQDELSKSLQAEARPYPMTPQDRRRAILESRINRGESVPEKLLAEFPDLVGASPKVAPVTPTVPQVPPAARQPPTGGISHLLSGVVPKPELIKTPPVLPPKKPAVGAPEPGFLGDLQNTDELVTTMTNPDVYRKIANLPGIKNVLSYLNPAGVANTVPQKGIIARAALREEGANKAIGAFSNLEKIGSRDNVWGKLRDGAITQGNLQGHLLDEVLTYRNKYAPQMTPQQLEWANRFHELEVDKLDLLERNGIEINKLFFEEGGEYVGRRVAAKIDPNTGDIMESAYVGSPGPGRPGTKMGAEKSRYFKDIGEAVAQGFRYLPPDEALFLNIKGAYNRIADKQMTDWILDRIAYRTTGAPQELIDAAQAARVKLYQSKQMLAALNRALRGERGIPEQLVNTLEGNYPKEAQELSNLIKDIRAGVETGPRVRAFTQKIKTLIDKNTIAWNKAVLARVQAREMAMKPHYQEATVQAGAFSGKILTGPEAKETAQILSKAFNSQYGDIDKIITAVNKANSIGRYFMLAGDFSPLAIQLITFPFRFPVTYVKAVSEAVKALFGSKAQAEYLANNNDIIQKSRNLILSKGGQTEFTEAFGTSGLLSGESPLAGNVGESATKKAALYIPRLYGKIGHVLLEPFQRFFEAALDTAGIELRKSFDYMATTPQRTAEVEQFINEIRGVTSSARIGVSPHMRAAETSAILAPRYNRAIAALVSDIARGGIRGDQARKALMALIAGGVALTTAITLMRGEGWEGVKNHLDIRNTSTFVTWDVAGQRVGPGSKIRSLVALLGKIVKEPERIVDHAYNFMRGNFSPVLSTGYDILMGKDYIGDPTRPGKGVTGYGGITGVGEGMLGLTKRVIADNLLPIWVQSAVLEGSESGGLTGMGTRSATEFVGGRAYPVDTSWLYGDKWRDELNDYFDIPSNAIELAAAQKKDESVISRADYREQNPEIDAKLFIVGQVTTIRTEAGINIARRLILENGIDPETIKAVQKWQAEQEVREETGVADTSITLTERFIMSLLAEESTTNIASPEQPTQTTPTTSTQQWNEIINSDVGGRPAALAFDKVWNQQKPLTVQEIETLRKLFERYPLGQTNFNTWYKQTMRQLFERMVAEQSKK